MKMNGGEVWLLTSRHPLGKVSVTICGFPTRPDRVENLPANPKRGSLLRQDHNLARNNSNKGRIHSRRPTRHSHFSLAIRRRTIHSGLLGGDVKESRNGNPTRDLQMATDRTRPHTLCDPVVS